MKMIDFHTHILPAIDDGAKTVEESCLMLDSLRDQGVGMVVCTPHYYSQREPIERFLKRRDRAIEKLSSVYSTDDIKLFYGAEVHYSDYLFNNEDISSLCIADSDVMLLELPYNKKIDRNMLDRVWQLMCDYGVTPVIAHVERYASLWRSEKLMNDLTAMGCVLQVNLSSATCVGKRRIYSMISKGYIGAFGTDAHNTESRPPDYRSGFDAISRRVDEEIILKIQENMTSLLR